MKKQHVSRVFFIFALLAIIITSCSSNKVNATPTLLPTNTPANFETSTPFVVNTGILAPKDALRQMYGKDAQYIENDKVSLMSPQGNAYIMNLNFLACYSENFERERCVVITDSTNYCISCGARVDAAIFYKTDAGWLLHSFDENTVNVQAAYSPTSELIQIGNGKYAVLVTGNYARQGYESKHIAIFAETENFFGSVLELTTSENYESLDNKGNTFRWGYITNLDFYTITRDTYYRLTVKYSGNNQYGEMPKYQIYIFSGTKYVLSHEEK